MAPAALKNTADPPGASAVSPNGVYTESSAIEPTTSRLTSHPIRGADPQKVEAVGEHPPHRRREDEACRLLRLAEHAVLVVPGVGQAREPLEVAGNAVRLERLRRPGPDPRERRHGPQQIGLLRLDQDAQGPARRPDRIRLPRRHPED